MAIPLLACLLSGWMEFCVSQDGDDEDYSILEYIFA
jgi:hypothetical protein